MTKQQAQRHAESLLKYYQPIFRLQDWDISITAQSDLEYAQEHSADFDHETWACNSINVTGRASKIYVRYEVQQPPMGENLIHELVHLMIHDMYSHAAASITQICDTSVSKILQGQQQDYLETTVCQISKALLCVLILGGRFRP